MRPALAYSMAGKSVTWIELKKLREHLQPIHLFHGCKNSTQSTGFANKMCLRWPAPFFFPTQRASEIQWNFPARLPLGGGFCGTCKATSQEFAPSDAELRDFCNLGYAGQCANLPADRRADCVRFSIAQDQGTRILLHFVLERDHVPMEWGTLEFDVAALRWSSSGANGLLRRQAESYLSVYLERKPRAFSITPC